jgi:hypothetical protein
MQLAQAEKWTIRGTLLTPDALIEGGGIVIDDDKIADVGISIPIPSDARTIPVTGVVLPAFVDLHNHLTWNVFPRWRPTRKFANRYEWQEVPEYDRLLRTPQASMIADGLGCEADLFAEIKAIAGGAGSVIGSFGRANSADGTKCIDGLARNLDLRPGFPPYASGQVPCPGDSSGFPPTSIGVIANEVFPLESPPERFTYYKCEIAGGRLRALVMHLAEGSSVDSSARREFRMIKGQNKLFDGAIIIHGAALGLPEFQDMRANNVGLIWSPRSNEELYGTTANISAALEAGVTIALAPDWSPTGSAGMLQELNFAAARYPFIKPEQLVAMATSIPAKLARIDDRVGRLAKGLYADILAIRRRDQSPYTSVVTATPADIELVMIGGEPVFGDYDLLEKIVPIDKLARLTICGTAKAVNFAGIAESWDSIQTKLEMALRRYGTTLSFIECD